MFLKDNQPAMVTAPPGTYIPYNAQATLHTYDTFWALLLPASVQGRVSDIWRSYFSQRLFRDLDLHVIYTKSLVTQNRNSHDYQADMEAEWPLYSQTESLLTFLDAWRFESLKDRFGQQVDWNDETWFTFSKGALVKKLKRDGVRGTSGVDEVPGKIGVVRLNPDADLAEGRDGISTSLFADDIPDLVTIIRKLLKTSKLSDKCQRCLALNLTYAADGLSGEVKCLNYQGMACDPVGSCAAADWKDLKNGTNRPTTFCTDYDRWETCVFDALGGHWSVDGGLSRTCNYARNLY